MKFDSNPAFNPKRLKEARLIRGFTISELAEKISVSKQAVSQFELGESTPKLETMLAIINILKFPKSYFNKPSKEQFVGNTFFRANSKMTKRLKEMQLHRSYMAYEIYDYIDQYIDFPKLNIVDIDYSKGWDDESIENLTLQIRDKWGLGDSPINNIVHTLEKNGYIVFSLDTDSDNAVDAYYQHRGDRPFIFLGNDKQSAFRRQFDGAHELGHAFLHPDIEDINLVNKEDIKVIEGQANKFASAFLMPAEAFKNTITSTSLIHFIELKKYWKVSMAAMIYRCKDLGIIDDGKYTSLQKQISMKKMRLNEPLDNVYPIQQPVIMKKSIELLLKAKVKTAEDILFDLKFPREEIEMLCSLERDTLALNQGEPTVRLVKEFQEE